MNYGDGIKQSLDKIFAGVLVGGLDKNNPLALEKVNNYKVSLPRFLTTFPSNIFKDEYAFFYEMIHTLKIKYFNQIQMEEVIDRNTHLILDSPYIDLSKWAVAIDKPLTDEERVEAFKQEMIEIFNKLSNTLVGEEEFKSSCEIYIEFYKNYLVFSTAQNMTLIMSDTGYEEKLYGKRAKKYKGYEDALEYYNNRMKLLRELSEASRIDSVVIDDQWYTEEMKREEKPDDKSLMTIGIEEIDVMLGELRRGNMVGVLGPPKGGKTRFSNYLVQRALSLGLNVCVWPLEGTDEEWLSMQVASFIRRTSNISLNSKDILQRRYPNEAVRNVVAAAKLNLSTDPKMGRLSFIKGTAYVEDFIDVLQEHYDNENPFDVIVIDSLVNILSKGHKNKVERISEAYMQLKNFIANKLVVPALAILPAQLKQDTVDFLRKNPNETIDVTAGGESAETIRSPDEVIGLFSTKEERAGNIMKIYSVASRHSQNFDDIAVGSELGCCHFYSNPSLNQK